MKQSIKQSTSYGGCKVYMEQAINTIVLKKGKRDIKWDSISKMHLPSGSTRMAVETGKMACRY